MSRYVDGFVFVVPKRSTAAYQRIARRAGKVWRDHGALEYRECIADDLAVKMGLSYRRLLKLKANETAWFSWIVYRSRVHRDRVNAKVMRDPRLQSMMSVESMPFDMKRMSYGGFRVAVDL